MKRLVCALVALATAVVSINAAPAHRAQDPSPFGTAFNYQTGSWAVGAPDDSALR